MDNEMTADEIKFIDEQDLKNRFPEECKRCIFHIIVAGYRDNIFICTGFINGIQ